MQQGIKGGRGWGEDGIGLQCHSLLLRTPSCLPSLLFPNSQVTRGDRGATIPALTFLISPLEPWFHISLMPGFMSRFPWKVTLGQMWECTPRDELGNVCKENYSPRQRSVRAPALVSPQPTHREVVLMFAKERGFIKEVGQERQHIVLQITLKLLRIDGRALSGLFFQIAAETISRIMSHKAQVLQSG